VTGEYDQLRPLDRICIECRILEALAVGRRDLAEAIAGRCGIPPPVLEQLQQIAWLPGRPAPKQGEPGRVQIIQA
jgi:hypothetical protein